MELPRTYVSWSQMSLWEKSKSEYIKRYRDGKNSFETEFMRIGSKFAADSELGLSNDEIMQFIIDLLPEGKPEVQHEAFFGKTKLLIKQDRETDKGFHEFKTGTVEWTQDRVNKHGQLDFYAFSRHLLGLPNDEIWLHWFPVKNGKLTGEMISFRRIVSEKDFDAMKKRINRYIKEVKHYKVLNLKD